MPLLRRKLRFRGRAAEVGTLLILLAIALASWSFVELADEVIEGDTHATDRKVLLAMRAGDDLSDPIGPGWVEELGRDFTALGGTGISTLATVGVIGWLLLARKRRMALLVAVTVGTGIAVSLLLKEAFDRPRPDLVPHGSIVYTRSFPSGHSMMAAVVYFTLAALLARVQPHPRLKAYVLGIALAVVVLVGVSRVYLGVHWPTDVLAGWTAGLVWALAAWIVARRLQVVGQVEQPVEEEDFEPLPAPEASGARAPREVERGAARP